MRSFEFNLRKSSTCLVSHKLARPVPGSWAGDSAELRFAAAARVIKCCVGKAEIDINPDELSSGTTRATEVVHLSKFTGFNQEGIQNYHETFCSVDMSSN